MSRERGLTQSGAGPWDNLGAEPGLEGAGLWNSAWSLRAVPEAQPGVGPSEWRRRVEAGPRGKRGTRVCGGDKVEPRLVGKSLRWSLGSGYGRSIEAWGRARQ